MVNLVHYRRVCGRFRTWTRISFASPLRDQKRFKSVQNAQERRVGGEEICGDGVLMSVVIVVVYKRSDERVVVSVRFESV